MIDGTEMPIGSEIILISTDRHTDYAVFSRAIDYVTYTSGPDEHTYVLHLRGGVVLPISNSVMTIQEFMAAWDGALHAAK